MNLFRTRKLSGINQLTRIQHPHVCRMCTTPPTSSPPSDTLSGNHPEPVIHPRMNSSSELIASFYLRSPIAFHLSCLVLFAMIVVYLLFLPPLISGRLCCYRYCRASRQAVHPHPVP